MLYKALRQKDIKIDGNRTNKDCILYTDNEILIYISDEFLYPTLNLNIIFEDDNILILNKPVNLEVTGEDSLTSIVHEKYSEYDCEVLLNNYDNESNELKPYQSILYYLTKAQPLFLWLCF